MKFIGLSKDKSQNGFTIVELLVVIVVIGILAVITAVSYTGITQKAATAVLQSDIKNSSTQLAIYYTTNGSYPADINTATAANLLVTSDGTSYQYSTSNDNYCLSATSASAVGNFYRYSSKTGTLSAGSCSSKADILVVAGGGGGGSLAGSNCGGGGAGGVLYSTNVSLTSGISYGIVVGTGGTQEISGSNSTFDNINAIGGGHGGCITAPASGGSGGGARFGGYNNHGSGTIGQGFDGGDGHGENYGAGGGGGAGEAGNTNAGGAGGDGLSFDISGTLTYYGGGGGGGASGGASQLAPLGGGGRGAYYPVAAVDGAANTGGGGGGGADGVTAGGSGGSGIVIIRYLTGSITANGGTVTTSGSYTIHTFTGSGIFTVN